MGGFLDPNDPVAISFWVISIAMVAATVFFLMESMAVGLHWKTSMNVGALVTLVAAVHYFYMREFWVQIGSSPIVYRYIDWSIIDYKLADLILKFFPDLQHRGPKRERFHRWLV